MSTAAPMQPAWLAFAWADLGEREIAGPASNPRIAGYIRRVGHPEAADDATAWCAAFVGACLDRAGVAGTGSLLARSFLDWGEPAGSDELGAVAILSRGGDPAFGHVGFLVGATADALFLLGGNQSDAVSVARFDRARLLGLRRPSATQPPAAVQRNGLDIGFASSLTRILAFEGGWTDDPFDPGGPTNKGITLAVYARFVGERVEAATVARLKSDLKRIPDDIVERIYLERYWRPSKCPELRPPLAHFHFDAAVNQGVGGAVRMLQEALGVEVDGEIGPVTLSAAASCELVATLGRYANIRRRRYRELDHFWRFGRGWLSRVDQALAQSTGLVGKEFPSEPAAPAPSRSSPPSEANEGNEPMPDTTENAQVPAAPQAGKWWGESLTIWGVLLTMASTVAPTVFAAFGLDVSPDLVERLGRETLVVAQALAGLIGTILSIAGRARATTPLTRRAVAVRL